jgi:hypothetical protein
MTQTDRIYNWLLAGHKLTPLQALKKFNSLRLGARIYEIRQCGVPIETKYVTRNGKTYAEYRML